MATFAVPVPTLAPSVQSYTPAEWERVRPFITQLYRDERRSLKDVRTVLARQHGFFPTMAMIKKRITKWSIDKKNKEHDMLAALRLALWRETQGKKTVFVIRDRTVTFEEVKRYFRRKGVHDLNALATEVDGNVKNSNMGCHTPTPSPRAGNPDRESRTKQSDTLEVDIRDHELVAADSEKRVQAIPSYDMHLCPMLALAGGSSQLHLLLVHTHAYFDMFFDALDRSSISFFHSGSWETFKSCMAYGKYRLECNRHSQAFTHFDKAFGEVHDILRQPVGNLTFLPYLFVILRYFKGRNQAVACQLLRFVNQMSSIALSATSPLRQTIMALCGMPVDWMVHSVDFVCETTFKRFVQRWEQYRASMHGVEPFSFDQFIRCFIVSQLSQLEPSVHIDRSFTTCPKKGRMRVFKPPRQRRQPRYTRACIATFPDRISPERPLLPKRVLLHVYFLHALSHETLSIARANGGRHYSDPVTILDISDEGLGYGRISDEMIVSKFATLRPSQDT